MKSNRSEPGKKAVEAHETSSVKVDVQTIKVFERQARRLMKKHPSLKGEIQTLVEKLEGNPTCGVSIGRQCYKIRLAIASKGRGKAGGARVITYFISDESIVYLLSIYDKSERGTITDSELERIMRWSGVLYFRSILHA